jgi:glycosyltransferase involved in cell wall biosynthesis
MGDRHPAEDAFTVVVGTFGEDVWRKLAVRRAIPSAREQGARVIHKHAGTLAEARNAGLAEVETEFTIHLDADDALAPGYLTAMANGSGDLRPPMVKMHYSNFRATDPYWPHVYAHDDHDCVGDCLRYGNWMVIGTAVRTELARSVGGWEEWGWSEDWALWARCWRAGATIERVPDAVYTAYRRPGSRNRQANKVTVDWHRQIEAAVWPDEASVL